MEARGPGALPNVLVIGAMKAGTSALHRYLDAHPDAAMSAPKELGFFFDERSDPDELTPPTTRPETAEGWSLGGNWFRGLDWYRSHFDPAAPVRGESSPGYTSPDHPAAAARAAALLGRAVTLVMLVRDPVARAVSQYAHHHREGAEPRPLAQALLDPGSQYLQRSRYHACLRPWLDAFGADRLVVVVQEELRTRRRETLRRVYAAVGLDPDHWDDGLAREWHVGEGAPAVSPRLHGQLREALADDTDRLRQLLDRELPWAC
ncbi:sulfotransferase [Egicoccus halophilus]|uniref:Sulfotransferase family protein n=1 Tax=Egicoccus halophilus TaxID=1670830 RepID=A0A8J3AG62_9ACTN|nr:sulfotransferase [Egicoccus halophilus]GGI08066.1 hypothetical protein GCM10011354_27220 [Egicoccus halophilus]